MFAGQASAGVEQLPLLVTQGAAVTLLTLAAIRLSVQWDALSMDALAALAGVEHRLVTLLPAPARLAVAHRALNPVRLADAVHAVDLLAGLAAGDHARLHLGLGEVLELIVDVQVLDTAMETGAVLELPETENA